MSTQVAPETPWLGLRCYTEKDRDYFFGRTMELDDLFERVIHKSLTILFGQSGLGKTSLLRAGLIPRLRNEGFTPILIRLDHSTEAPSYEQQVLMDLNVALGLPTPDVEPPTLWQFFHDPAFGFISHDGTPRARPLLIFDQFEELFTLGRARYDSISAFRDALSGLVENRIPESIRRATQDDDALAERLRISLRPCKVLLSLREDFLHQLERWRHSMPSLMENRMELRLLAGPQALDAVVQPGKLRCRQSAINSQQSAIPIIADDTGTAIVRFVAGALPDAPLLEIDAVPPLLSLLCAELNNQRLAKQTKPKQISAAQIQGSAEEILERFYGACFASAPPGLRELIEDRLLSPDGHRQSVTSGTIIAALGDLGVSRAETESALDTLVNTRLLTVEERGGTMRVELTHDILTGVVRRSRDQRTGGGGQLTALVVDDDEAIQSQFKLFLRKAGVNRIVVGTGKQALAALKKQRFDLCFLDLQLPDVTGDKIYAVAKTDHPDLPIVIITGHADSEMMSNILKYGPVTY